MIARNVTNLMIDYTAMSVRYVSILFYVATSFILTGVLWLMHWTIPVTLFRPAWVDDINYLFVLCRQANVPSQFEIKPRTEITSRVLLLSIETYFRVVKFIVSLFWSFSSRFILPFLWCWLPYSISPIWLDEYWHEVAFCTLRLLDFETPQAKNNLYHVSVESR